MLSIDLNNFVTFVCHSATQTLFRKQSNYNSFIFVYASSKDICLFPTELVRSKNNLFAEFERYYATKRAIKITKNVRKEKE